MISEVIRSQDDMAREGLVMELQKAKAIAEELKSLLEPACERITIAGSIRRQKPDVGDIELLCIPKYVDGVDQLDRRWIT
ncbi:MAG: hypothetical protein KJ757_08345 [Planctomycetes bacterium]|nr:hypothetical protein [Planctomycetota bacterium]